MTKLLIRLFIRDPANIQDRTVRTAYGNLACMVGIVCNVLLFAGKFTVGTLFGSMAIAADALNNLSDASSNVVSLVGFRLGSKPADDEHPYGHARYEYLAGLAVSVMILVIGIELLKESFLKVLHPTPVTLSALTIAVLVVSILVKLWMSSFNRSVGSRIKSETLMATAADARNDVVTTAAVLAATILAHLTGIDRIDGLMGVGVALFILWSGIGLAKDTISPLLGEGADPELREKIVDKLRENPKVLGFHDLMVHDYGPGQRFASIHVEMDRREDPMECHEIIDDLERECLKSHGVHLVIHYDPVVTDDPELDRMHVRVEQILHTLDLRLGIHDFRMVPGKEHTNLIFDVVLPSDLRGQEEKIQETLTQELNTDSPITYYPVITFDQSSFN